MNTKHLSLARGSHKSTKNHEAHVKMRTTNRIITIPSEEPKTIVKPDTRPKGLTLHCGADVVSREEVHHVITPRHTETWYPMPHSHLIEEVENQLWHAGFHIRSRTHALSHEGARYFGLIEVYKNYTEHEDYTWIVGIRNSHDKSIPAGVVAGSRVFVCDNLAFNGMVKIQRKHTRYAQRDLRPLTKGAIEELDKHLNAQDLRISHYKEKNVTDLRAHDMIVRAVDAGAITNTQIPDVLEQWRDPAHECFQERNAWSLFNAFTEITKTNKLHTQVRRGENLQRLFDEKYPVALVS